MTRSFWCLALVATALQGCGGSDSSAPQPAYPVQAGDFELIAGTLGAAAPVDAPRYQNGPAIGADLRSPDCTLMAVGGNDHVYLLKQPDCSASFSSAPELDLIEIAPSTGLMQVHPVPYNPRPERDPETLRYVAPAPAKTMDPAVLAIASDGSALIGDGVIARTVGLVAGLDRSQPGYGFGVWRFKAGTLSKLAGFDAGASCANNCVGSGQDGKGGEATFVALDRMCTGPDNAFYVNDNLATYRKILLDGAVQTIGDLGAGRPADPFGSSPMICASNQRVFAQTTQDGRPVFSDLVSNQTFGPPLGDNAPSLQGRSPYGFGDGLLIIESRQPDPDGARSLSLADTKTGVVSPPWITFRPSAPFQLDHAPYTVPMTNPQIVIDNNNHAYIQSGNALLRYKLPDRIQ
jgi:hypothetical protein